jgi:histidinol-phosphate aminotransferase
MIQHSGPRPVRSVAGTRAYSVPRSATPVDLYLDGNEGAVPPCELFGVLATQGVALMRDYPSTRSLEGLLARRLGVAPEQVIVTAGADDALDRICRAMIEPGRTLVLPEPSFEMFRRYASLAGGAVVSVPWLQGAFPTQAVIDAVDASTAVVVMVSPNNPTGAVATAEDLEAVAAAAPEAIVIVDHAYVEFADEDLDLSAVARGLPNVVVVRTLSKAWGLAGLRVGYATGSEEVIGWLRAAGHPYAVAGPSLALAAGHLQNGEQAMGAFVDVVRTQRRSLETLLNDLGATAQPSQGNFVFARHPNALWVRDAMASLGIAIRAFPGRSGLEDALRIACPGNVADFARLEHGLRAALAPEAVLFDVDGVLADVSRSYRQCIIDTAASFGVVVSPSDITEAKNQGDANNDWVVTRRLLAARGVEVSLEEVTERFEAIYQGTEEAPGLRRTESLLCAPSWLATLARRIPLGIITGRPRRDAERFLNEQGIAEYFDAVVCMEDGPLKPDPAPVRRAMALMGVERAWFIGDTPDDARAGRGAGVVALGVVAPGETESDVAQALIEAGAGRILSKLEMLEEMLT